MTSIQCDPPRRLVLHADDFGLNADISRGIVGGFSAGLLTSTAILANAPAARLAVDLWQRLEESRQAGTLPSAETRRRLGDPDAAFDLGVHLNLSQGKPLTASFPAKLLDGCGRFLPPSALYRRLLRYGNHCTEAIEGELAAQIEFLASRGLPVSHLNGHQYVEMMPVIVDIVPRLARRFGISHVRAAVEPRHWLNCVQTGAGYHRLPGIRLSAAPLSVVKQIHARRLAAKLVAAGVAHPDAFFGASHAGRVDLGLMRRFLRAARKAPLIEIALHPGLAPAGDHSIDEAWRDPLAAFRAGELEMLRSSSLADLIVAHGRVLGRLALGGEETVSGLVASLRV